MARITRRQVLAGVGATLVAASGAIAVVRTRGYEVPKDVAERLVVLAPWQYVVLGAVARRIAAADVDDGSVPTADDVGVVDFLDGYLGFMPDALRRDFLRLLAFVEHVAPLGCKLASRFTRLSGAEQDRVLAWMESNSEGMLRGGFDGLKSCVFMGYYRDPRTWKIIGYAGPFVPEEGDVIIRGRDLEGEIAIECDACVIGTGAGGGMALRELARAGLKVIALEEGGFHTPADFTQREDEMLPLLFQDAGGRMTRDLAIRVLQGRGVGGSTIHNTNLCKRTPDEILDTWRDRYAVSGCSPSDMVKDFERVESDLSVAEIPAALRNPNNEALHVGARELGWKSGPLKHNRVGCQMSGFCELGCAYDAKQNVAKVLVPQAEAAGAKIYADTEAVRITHERGRVTGVVAVAHDEKGGPRAWLHIKARIVVLAASAVGSAALAIKSDLPDPFRQIGQKLRIHPGAVVAGRFDRLMNSQYGIPQSYECTEHLSFEEGSDQRVWIVPAFAHPIGTASMLPGFGKDHMRAMRSYGNLAVLTAMVHDETAGRVSVDSDGRPAIDYVMNDADRAQLAKGLIACARLLFAGGAAEVVIPAIPPVRLKSASELDSLKTDFVRPHGVPITAVHPMGTLRMGDDPHRAVVDSTGEHHFTKGLFVADGSLFPTSLGGPPQISIYTFALHLSKHMIARAKA